MLMRKMLASLIVPLLLASSEVNALLDVQHIVIAPTCLLKKLSTLYQPLAISNNLVLFETNEQGVNALIEAKTQQKTVCGGFIDVTENFGLFINKNQNIKSPAQKFLNSYALSLQSP